MTSNIIPKGYVWAEKMALEKPAERIARYGFEATRAVWAVKSNETFESYSYHGHRFWKDDDGDTVYVVRCVMKEDVISALEDWGDMTVGKALRDRINNLSDEEMCLVADDFSKALDMDDY